MRTLILPLGEAGWSERARIIRDIIASRQQPPLIYNDVLVLVPSARLKRRYGLLFLEALQDVHRARCLVQPDIQTLHQFIQRQYGHLQGPRLIDEQSRLVLLEGLVKERLAGSRLFSQSPDLLAPSLSSVMARTVEQLALAGTSPGDLSGRIIAAECADKPQVVLLQDVYAAYQQVLHEKNLTDPGGMRHVLLDGFDQLPFAQYRLVILDGIHDAEHVEAEILRRLSARTDCMLLVDAPSWELVDQARQSHPLRIVKDFLGSLAPSAVPQASPAAGTGFSLAQALFSDESFEQTKDRLEQSAFSGSINLLSALNMREEVSHIARQVKESLGRGASPDSILVAFPSIDEYAPLVEELFADYGIPYNRSLGRQLGTSAVATALITLLRAGQNDFSGASLLRVFSSPFLRYGDRRDIAPSIDRFLRERTITGGRQKLLSSLKHAPANTAEAVQELIAALDPFITDESTGLPIWMDRLARLLAWSRLRERVNLIKGPLNVNQQAFDKLMETLHSLAAAGRTFPQYRYTFSEWLFLLRKTLMHARFQVPPEDEGGVQVLGIEESIALPWKEIYLGGMIEGHFPQRLPQNIFLPEHLLQALGIRTLEHARLRASYHFYRLLLSADRVTLSHPEQEGDKPVVESPFLKELEPLKLARILNRGVEKTKNLQFSLAIADSRSLPELAKAIAVAAPDRKHELRAQIAALPEPRPETADRIAALIDAGERPTGAQASLPCPGTRDFRVTDLDVYLACPYDYYITRVLGIEPLEELSDDLSPMERGSKVHAVLRDFYQSWTDPVTAENRAQVIARLRELAGAAFSIDADTFRNRRTRELFQTIMAERFVDAEIAFWTQGMKPAYLEQAIDQYPLPLSNGSLVHLSGKIDRIDLDDTGNFMVVDYKTGKYPLPRKGIDQDIFQLPIYAVMAKHRMAEAAQPLRKPIGLAYYDLGNRTGGGARDAVLFDKDARNDHPSSKPQASPKSEAEFEAILQQSLDKARIAVEGILAGQFPAAPREENRCGFCASRALCRREDVE